MHQACYNGGAITAISLIETCDHQDLGLEQLDDQQDSVLLKVTKGIGDGANRFAIVQAIHNSLSQEAWDRMVLETDRFGLSPFWYACRNSHHMIVELLLQAPNATTLMNQGVPRPLWYSGFTAHHQIASSLLTSPGIEDLKEANGFDALMTVVLMQFDPMCDPFLKSRKQDFITYAAMFGRVQYLKRFQLDFDHNLLRLAIQSESADSVNHIIMGSSQGNDNLPQDVQTLIRQSHSKAIRNLIPMEEDQGESKLISLSKRYPVFNEDLLPSWHENFRKRMTSKQIDLDVLDEYLLDDLCFDYVYDQQKTFGESCSTKPCHHMGKRRENCKMFTDLLQTCKLLEKALRKVPLMCDLKPKFALIGSGKERTRVGFADELDFFITFDSLGKDDLVISPDGCILMAATQKGKQLLKKFLVR